jgi:hypothetical protein
VHEKSQLLPCPARRRSKPWPPPPASLACPPGCLATRPTRCCQVGCAAFATQPGIKCCPTQVEMPGPGRPRCRPHVVGVAPRPHPAGGGVAVGWRHDPPCWGSQCRRCRAVPPWPAGATNHRAAGCAAAAGGAILAVAGDPAQAGDALFLIEKPGSSQPARLDSGLSSFGRIDVAVSPGDGRLTVLTVAGSATRPAAVVTLTVSEQQRRTR